LGQREKLGAEHRHALPSLADEETLATWLDSVPETEDWSLSEYM